MARCDRDVAGGGGGRGEGLEETDDEGDGAVLGPAVGGRAPVIG